MAGKLSFGAVFLTPKDCVVVDKGDMDTKEGSKIFSVEVMGMGFHYTFWIPADQGGKEFQASCPEPGEKVKIQGTLVLAGKVWKLKNPVVVQTKAAA